MNKTKLPPGIRHTVRGEWVREESDGTVTIGVTDSFQAERGDMIYVDLPKIGRAYKVGEIFGSPASDSVVAYVYSPIAGKVVAVNQALQRDPRLVNRDPYGEGWLVKIRPTQPREEDQLFDAGHQIPEVAYKGHPSHSDELWYP